MWCSTTELNDIAQPLYGFGKGDQVIGNGQLTYFSSKYYCPVKSCTITGDNVSFNTQTNKVEISDRPATSLSTEGSFQMTCLHQDTWAGPHNTAKSKTYSYKFVA